MTLFRKAVLARVVLFASLFLFGCFALVRIDLTGGWEGSLLWISGPSTGFSSPMSLAIVHQDRDVTGTITLMGPGSVPFVLTIDEGRTQGRTIQIRASGVLNLGTTTIDVILEIDGDYDSSEMSGTGEQTVDGTTYLFTWELVRVSGPPES
jgi:hypothetical protein